MKEIWLIGTGIIGIEYAKVLQSLNVSFIAVGRGEKNLSVFNEATGLDGKAGGLNEFLAGNPELPKAVIVSVGVDVLSETTHRLLDYGVKKILLEKPGIACLTEMVHLLNKAEQLNAEIYLAYNRRFYSSVIEAEKIIRTDGGVKSFNFEFTEWSHIIANLNKADITMKNWFMANSTHVIDTAFYLGGKPKSLSAFHKGGTGWHPTASIYSGAGESESGALFCYHANWESPGRWVIEVLTNNYRLYFKPMESLQIQKIGSVAIEPVQIDDKLDKDFKPGFYLQTKAFLENDYSRFCTLKEQSDNINSFYLQMSGYKL